MSEVSANHTPFDIAMIDVNDAEGLERFLQSVDSDRVTLHTLPSDVKRKLSHWLEQQKNQETQHISAAQVSYLLDQLETEQPAPHPCTISQESEIYIESISEQSAEEEKEKEEEEARNVAILSEASRTASNSSIIYPPIDLYENILDLAIPELSTSFDGLDNDKGNPETETQLCDVCYDDVLPSDMFTLSCHHRYCKSCLQMHIQMRINSGWLITIPCMHNACSETIPDHDIRALATDEVYEKYKKFQELSELNANPACRWCPIPDCNTAVISSPLDPDFPCLTCTKCPTKFCFHCSREWHPNVSCKANAKVCTTKMEKKADKWRKKHKVRKCDQCGVDIEKDSGCNHMTCGTCGYQFCWICMKQFTPDHYINTPCAGLQFTAYPVLKRRLRRLKNILIGGLVILIAIPIVIVVAGVALIVVIIALPCYIVYRLGKFLKRKLFSKTKK